MAWFMASYLASRVYLLCNNERTLIAGLPPHSQAKAWHPQTFPRPHNPIVGSSKMACYSKEGLCIGMAQFEMLPSPQDEMGWRFYPNQTIPEVTGSHKPGKKFHHTYKLAIPSWASPIITKWVLCE